MLMRKIYSGRNTEFCSAPKAKRRFRDLTLTSIQTRKPLMLMNTNPIPRTFYCYHPSNSSCWLSRDCATARVSSLGRLANTPHICRRGREILQFHRISHFHCIQFRPLRCRSRKSGVILHPWPQIEQTDDQLCRIIRRCHN